MKGIPGDKIQCYQVSCQSLYGPTDASPIFRSEAFRIPNIKAAIKMAAVEQTTISKIFYNKQLFRSKILWDFSLGIEFKWIHHWTNYKTFPQPMITQIIDANIINFCIYVCTHEKQNIALSVNCYINYQIYDNVTKNL